MQHLDFPASNVARYTQHADRLRAIRPHEAGIVSASYAKADGSLRLVAFFAIGPVELGTTEIADGIHGLALGIEPDEFEGAQALQDLAVEVLALHVPAIS